MILCAPQDRNLAESIFTLDVDDECLRGLLHLGQA